MNRLLIYITVVAAGTVALTACHDDDETVEGASIWSLTADEVTTIDYYGRYYQLTVSQRGEQDSTLVMSTDADWIELTTDRLPADGIIEFLAQANQDAVGRTALIRLTSATNPERTAAVSIRQRGLGEADDNADDSDPLSDYRVGWGFDAYGEYMSLNSMKKKVIDTNQLGAFDSDTSFVSLQESVRGRMSFNTYSAYSLQEMSATLTKQIDTSTRFLFFKKTSKRLEKVLTSSQNEQLYAYARMTKTVGSRSIDAGALKFLLTDNQTVKAKKQPFTTDFRQTYDAIVAASGSQRTSLIKKMLNDYGTHIVIDAAVGGMIDYVVTFDRNVSSSLEHVSEQQCSYFFGRKTQSESQNAIDHVSNSLSKEASLSILGGSSQTRAKIESTISTLQRIESEGHHHAVQLDIKELQDWEASISPACLYDRELRKNLGVVDFRFIPIWEVFPDAGIQSTIVEQVIALGTQSNCSFTDNELGVDNYAINISSYGTFGSSADASLVKVVYNGTTPIIEVCQEYVPKIRGDRRITVFYPVKGGMTRIGQGLFPGDGEGNPPAMLTFSGSDVYVNPVDGFGYNDRLTDVYYLHGNLYAQNYGTTLKSTSSLTVREQYLEFTYRYPIVKIGSGYWTRRCISEPMDFRMYNFTPLEKFEDEKLYANIFYGQLPTGFPTIYRSVFGNEENADGERTLWYLPKNIHIEELRTYIGKNCKSLFKGQVSGFEAEFLGYYGRHDVLSHGMFADGDYNVHRYKGKYCFIPCIELMTQTNSSDNNGWDDADDDVEDDDGDDWFWARRRAMSDDERNRLGGKVLILSPEYTISIVDIKAVEENYYLVRLYRTSNFKYE